MKDLKLEKRDIERIKELAKDYPVMSMADMFKLRAEEREPLKCQKCIDAGLTECVGHNEQGP